MNELALFAGAGGGILGGHMLGWKTVAGCEIEDYPRETLLRRQLDGCLPRFPIWDDICTFDGKPFKGKVDIVTGGFPCQDISTAGKGVGITGERSGLWSEMARVISEVRPRFAFMENSPMLTSRGLGVVLGDLAEMGYDARWCVLGADDIGAPHQRKRIWILAYSDSNEYSRAERGELPEEESTQGEEWKEDSSSGESRRASGDRMYNEGCKDKKVADSISERLEGDVYSQVVIQEERHESSGPATDCCSIWWDEDPAEGSLEPGLGRMVDGMANRVERIKAIGNGQVPFVATIAFLKLSEDLI